MYQPTYLACLDNTYKFTSESEVVDTVTAEDGRTSVILKETIFYPQGGGQPADHGQIESSGAKFIVADVRQIDGVVHHFGKFEHGSFQNGEPVKLKILDDRRMLNARLHSAGHLVDVVVQNLGLNWKPGKGYHFADSPYVEYAGEIPDLDKDGLTSKLQTEAERIIKGNADIEAKQMTTQQAESACGSLPDYVDKSKLVRIVTIGNYAGCPCGGTHVRNLQEIAGLEITKLRSKSGNIRVSYKIGQS